MSTYRCPVDDTVFDSQASQPGPVGHFDCPGPACKDARSKGVLKAPQAPAPATPAADSFQLSDAEKAQILAARANKS